MPTRTATNRRVTVALTGASGDLGGLLLPRLAADPEVDRIRAFGVRSVAGPKVESVQVDLTRPEAEADLAQRLVGVDTLFHLAFLFSRVRDPALAHELEVIGTMRVLAAAAAASVPRLVVASLTALYGASSRHPALLTERAALLGCPGSRFIGDKVEVEQQVRAFAERNPSTKVIVLRLAAPFGRGLDNPLTRLMRRPLVPTLLGFDPRWQVLHPHDAGSALHLALHARQAEGPFNIVGLGSLAFSQLARVAGSRPLPLPPGVARSGLGALAQLAGVAVPLPLLDYLRYSCVADGTRAEAELGFTPRYHAREAAASLRETSHGQASAG